jgi:hypothetical protein
MQAIPVRPERAAPSEERCNTSVLLGELAEKKSEPVDSTAVTASFECAGECATFELARGKRALPDILSWMSCADSFVLAQYDVSPAAMSESATPTPAAATPAQTHAKPPRHSAPPTAAVPFSAAAASSSSSETSTAASPTSWRRWIALPFFFGALAFTLFAVVSTVTHTYHHPLTLLSRYFGTPLFGTIEYDAMQTCEMSYFSLSHREVKLTQLSPVSQALVDGEIEFGRNATATAASNTPATRREELDEEDAELVAAEEAEIAAARALRQASVATPTNASMTVLQEDFESFAALFRSALPAHLISRKSKASAAQPPAALLHNARYRLMQYPHPSNIAEEQQAKKSKTTLSNRVPILFVHGNGGSYHQMRSLASRLKAVYEQSTTNAGVQRNDFYSADFHEENSAFSGRLLWRQAWFVNEALHRILSDYEEGTQVILVCHSMGAVVCRSIYALGNLPRTSAASGSIARVAMIGMLGGPQREPVLWTDSWMRRLYRVMNEGERVEQQGRVVTDGDFTITQSTDLSTLPSGGFTHLHPLLALHTSASSPTGRPLLLSLGGGERDFQIEMSRTGMEGMVHPEQHLSLAAHSIGYASLSSSGGIGAAASKGGLASVDHQCLAWCSQIVETLAASVQEVTTNLQAKQKLSESAMHAKQRAIWLPASLEALRKLAVQPVRPQASTKERIHHRGIAVTSTNKHDKTKLPLSSGFVLTDLSYRLSQLDSFMGLLRSRESDEGLLAVWNGRMENIRLCEGGEEGEKCVDVTARATIVHPQLNPAHAQLSIPALESKRLGVASTYMLYLTAEQLLELNLRPSQSILVRFTPSSGAIQTLGKLRPMRSAGGARERIMVSVRLLRGIDERVDGDAVPTEGGSSMRVVRWEKHIPAGVDYHMDVRVDSGGRPQLDADDIPLPTHITLFTLATASPSNSSQLVLPKSTYVDQIHVFYPSLHRQSRPVRVYRSKEDRVLIGLVVVKGVGEEGGEEVPSGGSSTLSFHSHSFLSFLHTLYLQFSLLPQILLGTALCLFGVQFEYLRKYERFPRLYELLELPSGGAGGRGWRDWTASSLVWSMAFLAVCFHLFFHGSLADDTFLPYDAPFTPSASTAATTMEQASLLSGWSFRRGNAWELGVCGFMLFAASVALCVVLEGFVYTLLWSGSKVVGLACGRCRNVTKGTAAAAPAAAVDGSSFSSVAAFASPTTPQTRSISFLSHRLTLFLWIGSLLLSLAFTLCLCLYDLKYFLGMGLLDTMSFLGRELTAWASTICMVFGVIEEHFYFRDLTTFVERYAVLGKEMSVLTLTAGWILVAILMQMFTFPDTRHATVSKLTEPKQNAVRSAAAYKSTGVVMILLISGVLLFPSVLASLRLDVSALTAVWESARAQQNAPMTASFFQPPPTKTTWDAAGTSGVGGEQGAGGGVVLLYPFTLSVSGVHTMSLITLTWVTMLTWCLFHIPFSPPILQSCCITAYGLALLFFNGQSMMYYSLYWMAFMLCLCILPHTLASMMYLLHCLLDFAEGRVGNYDGKFDDEIRRRKKQMHQEQQEEEKKKKKEAPAVTAAARDTKKRR